MRRLLTIITAVASMAVIGIAMNAFAHGGMGWGGGWGHHGPGWHHRGGYGPGYDDQMTVEQYKQFEQKTEAFFTETQELRANLYEKEGELQNEMAKDEPDAAKASLLQKESSALKAQFDQKRIDHMLEMRKIDPNVDSGFMAGGQMVGYGSYGGGNCW